MNLSNTVQYAIRILSYMAIKKDKIFSASRLVDELKISDKYLRHLMTSMSKAGLVKSVQGRHGGFMLSKLPSEISLNDIIMALEYKNKYDGCILGFEQCSDDKPCALHNEWVNVNKVISALLNDNSLEQIVNKQDVLQF